MWDLHWWIRKQPLGVYEDSVQLTLRLTPEPYEFGIGRGNFYQRSTCKNALKSLAPLVEIFWLPLSDAFKISLQSPAIRQGISKEPHRRLRSFQTRERLGTSHGLYRLIMWHLRLSEMMCPVSMIQCRSILASCNSEKFFLHMDRSPPESPWEGLTSKPKAPSFKIDFNIFGFRVSNFVSWRNRKCGSCLFKSFLRELLFTLAPKPLIFQDRRIIMRMCYDEFDVKLNLISFLVGFLLLKAYINSLF